jgi:hypothetical protein
MAQWNFVRKDLRCCFKTNICDTIWNRLTSYRVIPNAYISHGNFSDRPSSSSGAIQLRLPSAPLSDLTTVRLVASALIRERPKSHKIAFPLPSISTLSCKISVSQSGDGHETKDIYSFEVTVGDPFRMKIHKTQRNVMQLNFDHEIQIACRRQGGKHTICSRSQSG